RLADKLRAPVLIGKMSKGAIADDHPLCLGMNWNVQGHAGRLLAEADVVLGIGACDGMISGARSAQILAQQLIHVDWDGSQQGPSYPTRLHLNGPIGAILAPIAERVTPRSESNWSAETLETVRDGVAAYARGYCPWVLPVLAAIREALPRDAMLCTDSLIGLWAQRLFPAHAPATVHFPWATGTLGHGVSAGVGMALADPTRTVACLGGDGAFLYNSQELAAMRHYRRKLIVIVANDNCYSAIKFNLTNNFGRAIAYELSNPDLVKLGEAYGMRAVRLSSPDEIGAAVRDAVAADQSTLIDLPLQVLPPHP
ncbi:MAG TPA: thiamine pyrophosphate-dependent enzyme, partial [Chloroflexota bacterium]|nr:thiamine pyrophosphate-dependent enzyme [Chloroflexota bacterium]